MAWYLSLQIRATREMASFQYTAFYDPLLQHEKTLAPGSDSFSSLSKRSFPGSCPNIPGQGSNLAMLGYEMTGR
jgi:hypothetical protein